MEESMIGFTIKRATGSSYEHPVENLTEYTRKSYWTSFAKPNEHIIVQLDTKALVGEIRIFNKNAHAVDISLAVDDKKDEYISVKSNIRLPLNREFSVKVGYFPACFIRFTFKRHMQNYVSVYGIRPIGVSCSHMEQDSGPSLFTVISHTTENILFGPSLPASLPQRDCLSDHVSGSREWMKRHKSLLDGHIARLEDTLKAYGAPPPRQASSWMY